ncbi:GTP-binding protein [Saccharospirillum sp.]|uniref:GTP-binding protein n=1 Tax=Saccharospirillum sp. TaxID=2033801 RepID=UPI00349FFD45
MSIATERIPVTLLTGYLGAGKTTLLNRILSEDQVHRYAVIINEFGEAGIDGDLVMSSEEDLFEMSNGCVCCTVRGDLIETLHRLIDRRLDFDAVIIETTGLADPGPVAQTFFVDPKIQQHYQLDSVTTLVDSRHLPQSLAQGSEAAEQIAFADQIILNKTDLISADELDQRRQLLRALNPFARQVDAEHARVDVSTILNQGRFDLARLDDMDDEINPAHGEPGHRHSHDCNHDDEHHHDASNDATDGHLSGISSCVIRHDAPMDAERVSTWLTTYLAEQGQDILRVKGIVNVAGEPRKLVFQGVHMMIEGDFQRPWSDGEQRQTKIVWIGRDLDSQALQAALNECRA